MRVTLLSDTHGYLDERILHHCQEAGEIWHAGDFGKVSVLDDLRALDIPVRGGYGNVDGAELRRELPLDQRFANAVADSPHHATAGFMAQADETTQRIYESWSNFRDGVMNYNRIAEEALIEARNLPRN